MFDICGFKSYLDKLNEKIVKLQDEEKELVAEIDCIRALNILNYALYGNIADVF